MKTCVRYWVAMILALVVLGVCHQLWIPRGIYLDFDYAIEKPLNFQAFYSAESDREHEYRYEKCSLEEKAGHVRVFLPVKRLERFRLSLGKHPGKVEIRNLTLQGRETLLLDERNALTPHNTRTCEQRGNAYTLQSAHRYPYLERVNLGGFAAGSARELNVLNLLLLAFCPAYLFIVLWDVVREPRDDKGASRRPALLNIEFLRLLFTMGVLHYHFARSLGGVWSGGGQGVEFFFLLSGYLLALTYKPERSLMDVARRNWIRFVPLVVVGGLLAGGGWEAFQGVFMLQNTGLAYMDVPNGPAWYIAVLFWCTLFYLALFKAFEEKMRYLLVGTLTFLAYVVVVRSGGDRWNMIWEYIPRGMLRGMAGMGLGIILASFCRRKVSAGKPRYSMGCTLLEAAVIIYVVGGCFIEALNPEHWIFLPVSHALLLALFIAKKGLISHALEQPFWAYCGRYCLAIYLTHVFFLQWNHKFLWQWESAPLSLLAGVCLACLLGVLAYYLIEKPGVKYFGTWIDRLRD